MVKTADVVIIGGGISGVAIAFNLLKNGVKDVLVLEQSYLASGATGRCGAGIRQQWGTELNCNLAKFSCEFFENAGEELGYTGDIEFTQSGYLLLSSTEKEHEQFKKNVTLQNSLGIKSKLLNLDEAREIVPQLDTSSLVSATFHDKDGHLNPFHTTQAFADATTRIGGKIYQDTKVLDIVKENGAIVAVKTNKGDISTKIVVNAAGGWAQDVAAMVGVELPIYSERHQILVTEALNRFLNPMLMSFSLNLYCQQVPHGGLLIGRGDPSEPRDKRSSSSWQFLDSMSFSITNVLPILKNARVLRTWAGMYNMSKDSHPIYGAIEEVPGFFVACGFSGHGFMLAPATGVALAEAILGKTPSIPWDMLTADRFDKGEERLEPSVV